MAVVVSATIGCHGTKRHPSQIPRTAWQRTRSYKAGIRLEGTGLGESFPRLLRARSTLNPHRLLDGTLEASEGRWLRPSDGDGVSDALFLRVPVVPPLPGAPTEGSEVKTEEQKQTESIYFR